VNEIYNMKLHEILSLSYQSIRVIRVPGGWIYESYSENGTGGYDLTSCFVPYTLGSDTFRRHDDKDLPAFLRRQAD